MSRRTRSLAPILLLALLAAPGASSAGETQSRGDAAYEAGRFSEALAAYRQAEAAGELDGVGLYRMGYCVGAVERNGEASREVYARAAERLNEESARSGASLETHFYRVNVLLNLGREEEARQAALRGVEAAEAGAFAERTGGTAWFRIGKIYRDAGKGPEALVPLARALEAWERDGQAVPAYVERIVSFALEEADSRLARRGTALLARTPGGRDRAARAELALLVREGSLAEARAFAATGALRVSPTDQRYVESLLDRLADRDGQPVPLPTELSDGRPLRRLEAEEVRAELIGASRSLALLVARPPRWLALRQAQLQATSVAGQALLGGTALPCPGAALLADRRLSAILGREVLGRLGPEELRGPGWTAEERSEVVRAYRLFLALAQEALIRAAPLRAWATEGRYAPFLFKPLPRLARDRHGIRRSLARGEEGEAPAAGPPAGES
jgi:tetratricopeptide (TPR) repeat protein